ncbi:hypothetical protein BC831DRAFT_478988 [Entophlyctis helioformis]|nr:hypothetical protein BC831DRAFT_478988 [Entophlyctis helioformis]
MLPHLPVELWEAVFGFLPASSYADVALVSRRWHAISARLPLPVFVALVVGTFNSPLHIDFASSLSSVSQLQTSLLPAVHAASAASTNAPTASSSAHAQAPKRTPKQLWAVVRVSCDGPSMPDQTTLLAHILDAARTYTRRQSLRLTDTFQVQLQRQIQDQLALITGNPSIHTQPLDIPLIEALLEQLQLSLLVPQGISWPQIASTVVLRLQLATLSHGFSQISVRHPLPSALNDQPMATSTHIELRELHTQLILDSLPDFARLQSLRMQSDGRFLLDERGIYRAFAMRPLESISERLVHLCLDGPWFQNMIDHWPTLVTIMKRLVNLKTLMSDFDARLHRPETLRDLYDALPHLEAFGRLGRVDKSFWRLFPKGELAAPPGSGPTSRRLRRLALGNCKYPFSMLLDGNLEFLKDMAFGILWAFPCIEEVEIYLGYQAGLDMDVLLEIVRRLKEGRNWDAPEPARDNETSRYTSVPGSQSSRGRGSRGKQRRSRGKGRDEYLISDLPPIMPELVLPPPPPPPPRFLRRISIFQAADVETINVPSWKYAALVHGGGPPITLYVTDDVSTDGSLGRKSYRFGP